MKPWMDMEDRLLLWIAARLAKVASGSHREESGDRVRPDILRTRAMEHGLYTALPLLGVECIGSELFNEITSFNREYGRIWTERLAALTEAQAKFSSLGVTAILYKGFDCQKRYWAELGLVRTGGDCDLLVPEAKIAECAKALLDLGFLQVYANDEVTGERKYLPAKIQAENLVWKGNGDGHELFIFKRDAVEVELQRFSRVVGRAGCHVLFENAVPADLGGTGMKVLSPSAQVIALAENVTFKPIGRIFHYENYKLRDVAEFVRSVEAVEPAMLWACAERGRCVAPVMEALRQTAEIFPTPAVQACMAAAPVGSKMDRAGDRLFEFARHTDEMESFVYRLFHQGEYATETKCQLKRAFYMAAWSGAQFPVLSPLAPHGIAFHFVREASTLHAAISWSSVSTVEKGRHIIELFILEPFAHKNDFAHTYEIEFLDGNPVSACRVIFAGWDVAWKEAGWRRIANRSKNSPNRIPLHIILQSCRLFSIDLQLVESDFSARVAEDRALVLYDAHLLEQQVEDLFSNLVGRPASTMRAPTCGKIMQTYFDE
jgi:hypothetical protein